MSEVNDHTHNEPTQSILLVTRANVHIDMEDISLYSFLDKDREDTKFIDYVNVSQYSRLGDYTI